MRFVGGVGLSLALLAIATTSAAGEEWIPITRVAMGPSLHFAHDASNPVGFALDASAGVSMVPEFKLLSDGDGVMFNGELGYGLDSFGEDLHAFHVTAGVGYGYFPFGLFYQPRLLLGGAGDELAIGMRNGLRGMIGPEMLSLEVAHQFVHHHDGLHQDIHLLLGASFPWALLVVD